MKRLLQTICCAALLAGATASYAQEISLNEFYSVEVKKFNVFIDNAKHDIDIYITWNFKTNPTPDDYIDSNLVVNTVKTFLKEYPNKSDFWEVVNHKLTSHMIDKFKQVKSFSIKLDVPATKMDPYHHYTLVEASR